MDELEILISADIDQNKTVTSINKSIKQIEKKIEKLRLQISLDDKKSKSAITKEIEKLNKQKRQLYIDLKIRKDSLKQEYKALQQQNNMALNVDTSNAVKNVNTTTSAVRDVKNETLSLADSLKRAFANTGTMISMQSTINLVKRAAKDCLDTIKEYDSYVTNLSVITGNSREKSSQYLGNLAEKSLDFKIDISDLEGAAETLLRTGKSIDETNKYLENTIYLSKLGFQDMDTSASQLVTIGNAYEYSANEMASVVDKFVKLDTQANVTAGALAEGVAKSAQNAKLAGFNIDQLAASIAGLKDTTGRSESEISNSLSMIFSRLQNVKLGKFVLETEDGDTEDITQQINDMEKLLDTFGIKLRNSKNEFRDLNELFTELSANWSKFNSVQQSAIATTAAGARQRNTFIALIENWNKIQELTDVSLNSMGTAVEKYDNYLQSIEAKSAVLETSVKQLWNSLLPSDFIGDMTDAGTAIIQFTDKYQVLQTILKSAVFYGLAKGLILAKDGFTGMITSIRNVSAAMNLASKGTALTSAEFTMLKNISKSLSDSQLKLILSNNNLTTAQKMQLVSTEGLTQAEIQQKYAALGITQANQQAATATFSLSGAFKTLWSVLLANPVVSLTMAFTAVSTIITTVQQKQEKYRQSVKDTANETKEFADNINSLYNAYSDLKTGVDNGTASKEDLTEATNKLLEALGYEGQAVDGLIAKYGDLHTAINQATADRLKESLPDLANAVDVEFDELTHKANIQASMSFTIDKNDANKKITDFLNDFTSKHNTEFIKITDKIYNEYSAPFATDIGKEYSFIQIFNNDLDNSVDGIKKRLDELNLLKQSLFDYFGAEDVQNVDLYKTVNNQIANLSASYEEYTTALSDYNNTAAEAQIVQSLVGKEIPKTVEEYKKYRSELIKSANDSKEYIGSQEDIINSIDGTLSKMSEFADVQNRLNNIETAKDKFVIGKVNSKPISDFIDALSDDDLSILIQLDTNVFDKGIENVSQAIEDFKSNSDNQISVDVETSEIDTSSLEELQEAYDNLSKSAESYTKVQKTLTDAIKQQDEYGQLSADTIQSLTETGYAQALTVDKETGAVTLNTEAYERLNNEKKQKLKLDLEQQNTDLQDKIKEEESTISSLKTEYEALAKANAEANAERLREIEIELTAHSQDEARLRELVNKNNATKIGLDAPTFEKSDNKDLWKEEAEKKFADLEHLYAMDKISYASYLNQLDKLNQHYYGNNEKYLDDFYKYEEKVYQGRKKLAEDLLEEEEKTKKAYHDNRISELEAKITVTTNDSVDDQGNKLNASEKFDYLRAIYDEILTEIERRENEIVQSGVEGHEDELAELTKKYEEYANKKADIFKDEIQYEMDYISELEKKYDDFIEERIDRYENEKKAVEDRYDAEIKAIDKTIDSLKDKNNEAKTALDLKKAEQDLEKSRQRTRMTYGADGAITYKQDDEAIAEAQQKVDDIKLDMIVNNLEKQKQALEEQKDIEIDKYDDMISLLEEQKDIQEKYFETLTEILSNYSNPKATENIKSVWDRIFANKENVKVNDTNVNVKGVNVDTSSTVFGVPDSDKVNQTLDRANEVIESLKEDKAENVIDPDDFIAKMLHTMGLKTPDDLGSLSSQFSYNNIIQRDLKDIAKNITTNKVINNSQPTTFNFGDINVNNPVGDVKKLANEIKNELHKEAMMQIPNDAMRIIYKK